MDNVAVKDEDKTVSMINRDDKDEDAAVGSGDEEIQNQHPTPTAVNHAVTTTTPKIERVSGPKTFLKGMCSKNQMCMWIKTHENCNFLST